MAKTKSVDIARYINTKANVGVIRKAYDIYPILKSINNYRAVYECQGSEKKPYTVTIEYSDGNFDIHGNGIRTNCTCPYDYGGICKHTVASLENLALLFKKDEGLSSTPKKAETVSSSDLFKKETLSYPLISENIDLQLIKNDFKSKNISKTRYDYEILDAKPPVFKTQVRDWYLLPKQTIQFDKTKKIITLDCTCKQKYNKMYCEHLEKAVALLVEKFGAEYFAENYFEKKKENILSDFGLTLEDDYEKYFDFKMTNQGFSFISKFPNIRKNNELFDNQLSQKLQKSSYAISGKMAAEKPDYGEAVIFNFNRRIFDEFLPLQAKYNRERTELATHFKEISFYGLESHLEEFGDKFVEVILKLKAINYSIHEFRRYHNPKNLGKAILQFNNLLPLLKDFPAYSHYVHDTFTRKNLEPLIISEEKPELFFNFSEDEAFYLLEPKLKIGNQTYQLNSDKIKISPIFIKKDNEIIPFKNAVFAADLLFYIQNPENRYIKKNAKTFHEKVFLPLSAKYEIKSKNFVKVNQSNVSNLKKQVYIDEFEGLVSFKLAVQYPEKLIDIEGTELRVLVGDDGKFHQQKRDEDFENKFIEEFRAFHPDFQDQEKTYYLQPHQLVEKLWFLEASAQMKNSDIELFGLKNLKSFKYNLNKPMISMSVNSDIDWFDVNIDISFGDQKLSIKDLQKAFVKKSNFVVLGDGSIGILPEEWMKKFENYFKVGEVKKDALQISNFQFGIIDELYNELEEKPDFLTALYEKKKRIQHIEKITEIPIPKGVKAKLRDYQHHGLNWLNFLDEHQLGGCLADDMGLGKTLQAIAFLQHLKLNKKPKNPSLIVAPTSLIFNWEKEIQKFCPSLKMLIFTGNNRLENLNNFKNFDLVITTYGSLLNDIEHLKEIDFNYIILDESQAIKNPNSKRYKSVRLLKAYNRITLTGTPIENNTFDLYAQFNFLNAGLLGNMAHFKKEFSDAIDKEKEVQTSELLSKIISPFILRRTKEQVAKELPEKVESVLYCEMGKDQRKVYDTFKNQYREYLMTKIDENGIEKSQMYILEGLMKLRQICNSPAILADKEDYGDASVKLETLMENIKEKTGNHKILVFSSFVKMLQLIRNELDKENIPYEYLDGQTRDRQSKVENFQNEGEVRVFLISTKAGGTGLNLTEADYVFIVDPWWNPAVENQAIDRCYRIGQTKQVMAYRMICKDTIEEKIVALQDKKKKIATSIISVDDEKKSFNAQEVKDLFA